jgi:hypothetical protein
MPQWKIFKNLTKITLFIFFLILITLGIRIYSTDISKEEQILTNLKMEKNVTYNSSYTNVTSFNSFLNSKKFTNLNYFLYVRNRSHNENYKKDASDFKRIIDGQFLNKNNLDKSIYDDIYDELANENNQINYNNFCVSNNIKIIDPYNLYGTLNLDGTLNLYNVTNNLGTLNTENELHNVCEELANDIHGFPKAISVLKTLFYTSEIFSKKASSFPYFAGQS